MAKSTSSSALLSSMRFSMDFSGLRLSHCPTVVWIDFCALKPAESGASFCISLIAFLLARARVGVDDILFPLLRLLCSDFRLFSTPSTRFGLSQMRFFRPSGCSEPLLPGEPQGHFSPWSVPSLVFIFACGRCWTSPRRRCFPSTPPSLTM